MSGLLIDDKKFLVDGVDILSPDEEAWSHLNAGDGEPRSTHPQHKTLHKTIADDRELVLPGAGSSDHWGGAEYTAEYWQRKLANGAEEHHGGAHLVTGLDGRTACLEDLVRWAAYHNGVYRANLRSWGHEVKELAGGKVFTASLVAAVAVTCVDTSAIGVQQQCPRAYRDNKPLKRFENGGVDLVGVFGHREVSDTRGRWDPGDVIFDMLQARGFERFDFDAGEDLDVWSKRQEWLAELGMYHGKIDGVPFLQTRDALRALGFPDGIFARWTELPERPPMPPV